MTPRPAQTPGRRSAGLAEPHRRPCAARRAARAARRVGRRARVPRPARRCGSTAPCPSDELAVRSGSCCPVIARDPPALQLPVRAVRADVALRRACRRPGGVLLSGVMSFVCVLGLVVIVGHGSRPIPLSVIVLGSASAVMAFGAIRFQSRLFAFRRRAVDVQRTRVLLMGAGEAGAQVLSDILRHPELGLQVVGMVDDDPRARRTRAPRRRGARRPGVDPGARPASSRPTRCSWPSRAPRAI